MSANSAWPQGSTAPNPNDQPFGSMDGIGEQDFANLLDFESFDFLSNFDAHTGKDNSQQQNGGVDLNMLANAAAHNQHGPNEGQQRMQPQTPQQNLFDMQMGMGGFGGQQQHGVGGFSMPQNGGHMGHQMVVPPTPNSVEMHNDVGRYLQQLDAQTRAIIEHEFKMRQQDAMNFTPLGTPAVTPHDAQFNPAAQFAVPGEYFSPLVSPALEGQQQRGQQTSASTASTASPVDFDMDLLGESVTQQPKSGSGRRTRRTSASTRTTGSRKVAQSPIQKPNQKRKSGLSSVIPPKEVTELLEMHAHTRMSPTSPASARLSRAYASSSDSISPEPLSEGLMRPPPKPHSARQSPMIPANSKNHSPLVGPNGAGTMPATPASLMRIGPKDSPSGLSVPSTIHEQHGDDIPMLDDLILPDAAAPDPRNSLPKIDTLAANGGDATPRVSARGARGGPKSAPLLPSGPSTAKPSPLASTVTSPISSASSPMLSRQQSSKGGRTAKKRGSVTQLVSPALLPRISPSIKPLLPSGSRNGSGTGLGIGKDDAQQLTEEQHALLLTSRSNYQNLIEGRNIPGVTYPSDLPSQLTSKRTSHKIAEQGRRQRINVALQEMQGLLPKLSPGSQPTKMEDDEDEEDEEGGKGRKGGKGGGNSKAATVEHAILYIRGMQEKEAGWVREREEKDREVEALRKRLDALERRLSTSKSPASSGVEESREKEEEEAAVAAADGEEK